MLSHLSAFSVEFIFLFFFCSLRLAFVPNKYRKTTKFTIHPNAEKKILVLCISVFFHFFLICRVVIENARIRLRLAFSTEFQIHTILSHRTVSTVGCREKNPPRLLHSTRFHCVSSSLCAYSAAYFFLSGVPNPAVRYSSIVKMTPMLSSAEFSIIRISTPENIFILLAACAFAKCAKQKHARQFHVWPLTADNDHDFYDCTDAIRFRYPTIQYVVVVDNILTFMFSSFEWISSLKRQTHTHTHTYTEKNRFIRRQYSYFFFRLDSDGKHSATSFIRKPYVWTGRQHIEMNILIILWDLI